MLQVFIMVQNYKNYFNFWKIALRGKGENVKFWYNLFLVIME